MSRPLIKIGEIRAGDLKASDVLLWREGASRRRKEGGVWREVKTVSQFHSTVSKVRVDFTEGYGTSFNAVDLVTIQVPNGEAPDPVGAKA